MSTCRYNGYPNWLQETWNQASVDATLGSRNPALGFCLRERERQIWLIWALGAAKVGEILQLWLTWPDFLRFAGTCKAKLFCPNSKSCLVIGGCWVTAETAWCLSPLPPRKLEPLMRGTGRAYLLYVQVSILIDLAWLKIWKPEWIRAVSGKAWSTRGLIGKAAPLAMGILRSSKSWS